MTQPTTTHAPRSWRFWSSRTAYPPTYTPRNHERCEPLTNYRLTSRELIAMARAARARQSGAELRSL